MRDERQREDDQADNDEARHPDRPRRRLCCSSPPGSSLRASARPVRAPTFAIGSGNGSTRRPDEVANGRQIRMARPKSHWPIFGYRAIAADSNEPVKLP
jgi:hypothetical protein